MNCNELSMVEVWIPCAVCAIEVPLDEAIVPEATDELIYLCGLDCYARWRASAENLFPSLASRAS